MTKIIACLLTVISAVANASTTKPWLLIDNFEKPNLEGWHTADTQNDTNPFVDNPQVTEIRTTGNNHYLIKKPAKDGIIGNRKALTYKALPMSIPVGATYTFYSRVMVEKFPNNHAFGLSNLTPKEIEKAGYNAFEPTIRVTDKFESNGYKNDGTLMVKIDSNDKYRQYAKIRSADKQASAGPMETNLWYQLWVVVNNSKKEKGGQSYNVYMQGGEFKEQTLVYENADFRMKREKPLIYFFANTNTGSIKKPYGNGGLGYDDLYIAEGVNLTRPQQQ